MRQPVSWRHLWGELWRLGLALLSGGTIYLAMAYAITVDDTPGSAVPGIIAIDPAIGLICCGLLLLRRRWPLTIALLTTLAGITSVASIGAATIAFISLCTHRRWRQIAVVAVVSMITVPLAELVYPVEGWPERLSNLVVTAAFLAASIGIGAYIGGRREHLQMLRDRADTAEREQASRVAEAKATERARIAREMHDVLGHRISLIAMHAGALAYRPDLPPEQVQEIAGLLRDNSDQAVQELREVLGVLRGGAASEPLTPQPTLDDLQGLITEAALGTADVELDHRVEGAVPATTSRSGYRIIQEALTNARKHAPGMPVQVQVVGQEDAGISIVVRNDPPAHPSTPAGSGMGLVGLTERAVLAGGTLSYGPDRAGRFVLRAWLPWAHEAVGGAAPEAAEPQGATVSPWVVPGVKS